MKQLFTRNLAWKLLSLVIAIACWVAVAREPEVACLERWAFPPPSIRALRAAGVNDFVFAGCDALATLQEAYRLME